MTSFLRYAAIIGTMAYLSPVHERAPTLPGAAQFDSTLKTLEAARSTGQAIAALDPDTRARLLAHVAGAAGASDTARKPARP